jgi:hypothetical protein
VNNLNVGIQGVDALLNIDAEQHAIDNGNAGILKPNSFDGNVSYTFDICYFDANVAPSLVLAKGNYWGGGILLSTDWILRSGDCSKKGTSNIALDMTDPSTCVPTATCEECEQTGPTRPYPGNRSLITRLLDAEFNNAHVDFAIVDSETSRNKFVNLAAVGLLKNLANGGWTGTAIDGNVYAMEQPGTQMVQVSKTLKNAGPYKSRAGDKKAQNIFAGMEEQAISAENLNDQFLVYPNPTNQLMNIAGAESGTFNLDVINVLGQVVYSETFTGRTQIDGDQLDLLGWYSVRISDEQGASEVHRVLFTK